MLLKALEEKCQEEFGVPVYLTGDALAMDDSYPFRNVATLADHICKLVEEQPHSS